MSVQHFSDALQLGIRAHQAGRLGEARALYEQVLAFSPDNLVALNNLGVILGAAKQFAQAEALLRRVLGQAPSNVDAYVNLAEVLQGQGKYAEAVACCETAVKLAPLNKNALNTLVTSLTGAERYDDAIALLRKMIATHPGFAGAHAYLGSLYAKRGNQSEAAVHFRRAAEINPKDVISLVGYAECLMVMGRIAEALDPLEKALKLNPFDMRGLALMTLVLAELGRRDDERWLSDPDRLVHTLRATDAGYTAEEVAALNRGLSEFAANDPGMLKDPPQYATYNGWHSTTNLAESDDPAVAQLKKFIGEAFERRIRDLSREDPSHPFVRSAPTGYHLDLWAVKTLGGGKQLPHIHPAGWLSGVYYVDIPPIIERPDAQEAGWIQFGTSRVDIKLTRAPLTRAIKPEPGLMVTFPSYFWHDTIPLPEGYNEPRLCFAYDLHPVRGAAR